MRKFLLVTTGVLVMAAAAAAWWLWNDYQRWLVSPLPVAEGGLRVAVAKGAGFPAVMTSLKDLGLLPDARRQRYFEYHVRYFKLGALFKAGQYALEPGDTPQVLLRKITRGEVITMTVTIPEGLVVREVAARLVASGVLSATEGEDFTQMALDPAVATLYGFDAPSLEGYLFPETYRFALDLGPRKVLSTLVERFKTVYTDEFAARARELNLSRNQVVTLASIIEKETGAPEERPLIGSVYHNRLKTDMRLQADPTVIYGVADYHGDITRKHLTTDHPYNTYTRKGLPPGAIANPGADALKAALWPAKSDYLYFVSKNNGHHQFSRTYAEHARWVDQYQRGGRSTP